MPIFSLNLLLIRTVKSSPSLIDCQMIPFLEDLSIFIFFVSDSASTSEQVSELSSDSVSDSASESISLSESADSLSIINESDSDSIFVVFLFSRTVFLLFKLNLL